MVFDHPDDPTKLLKVPVLQSEINVLKAKRGFVDRLFPFARRRLVRKEFSEYRHVMKRHPEPGFIPPISHLYGQIKTNLGTGSIVEKVSDGHGNLAKTLNNIIDNGNLTDSILTELNEVIGRLFLNNVRVTDLNPNNLVYGYRLGSPQNPPKQEWVMIDGFGDTFVVPIRTMSKAVNKVGLNSSVNKLAIKAGLVWDEAARKITLPAA